MFEEPRSHDPKPTSQEREWMQVDPVRIVAKLMGLTVLALVIATAATDFNTGKAPSVVTASR
jgi:hypothetical protein